MSDQQRLRLACAYAQSDQSLCLTFEYSMIVKILTERHLDFLSLKGDCISYSESTHVKMPHCWKSHVTAHISNLHLPFPFVFESSEVLCRWHDSADLSVSKGTGG